MTAHPLGLAGRTDSSHVNRVVLFTQRDAQDPAPDVLTQIKREVDTLDQLEVSSPGTWATRVAALPARFRGMFQGGTYNRIRSRYLVYGMSIVDLLALLGNLLTANYTISAWLRLAQATTSGGKYTVIPDMLSSNAVSQPDTDRQPTVATSANGFPIITWTTAHDVLPWALSASNNATAAWGLGLWIKPTANIATRQRVLYAGFPGSANKVMLDIAAGHLECNWYRTAVDGRGQVSSAITGNVWQFVRLQFNGAGVADIDKMKIFVNEIELASSYADIGAGGVMNALNAPPNGSSFYTIGAREDQDAPTTGLATGALVGPNIFVMNNPMTAPQGVNLMNLEKPT